MNEQAKPELAPQSMATLARWGRPLAVTTAIVFCISAAFPAVAAFVRDRKSWPKWWGVLDVSLALFLALLALAVLALAQSKVNKAAEEASYRAYRVLTHGIIAMLVVFFLVGDWIVWSNCLTGLAWRAWILLYGLPAWFTAFNAPPATSSPIK
jgi:VIT1/CCC1 family predicted Fe2+/Mn2+ transporter